MDYLSSNPLFMQAKSLTPFDLSNPTTNKSDYFEHLLSNPDQLVTALNENPGLINDQDDDGRTLVHHAALLGPSVVANSEIHQIILRQPNADFKIQDKNGNTPVHLAAMHCRDYVTCRYIFPKYVERAIALGFDWSTRGQHGLTVLHLSAIHSYEYEGKRDMNLQRILDILIENKVPNLTSVIDAQCDSGNTAFYYCIKHQSLLEVQLLFKKEANPHLCGFEGCNPRSAIEELRVEYLKNGRSTDDLDQLVLMLSDNRFLLHKEQYVDLSANLLSSKVQTALLTQFDTRFAQHKEQESSRVFSVFSTPPAAPQDENLTEELLFAAIENGDVLEVKRQLALGMDPDGYHGVITPLLKAVILHEMSIISLDNCMQIVQALVNSGANINAGNFGQGTALHWAALGKNIQLMRFLLANGADVHARTRRDETPLHLLVSPKSVRGENEEEIFAAAQLLLNSGASTEAIDQIGKNTYYYVFPDSKLYELLSKHGV